MAHAAAAARPNNLVDEAYLFEVTTGVGHESALLEDSATESRKHYSEPYLRSWGNPFMRFLFLKMKWERETAHLSSAAKMAVHPVYQQIIGMGPIAIPYILAELYINPDHWFWALSAITGDNPIRPEHRGRIQKMTEDWIEWAKQQGYSV